MTKKQNVFSFRATNSMYAMDIQSTLHFLGHKSSVVRTIETSPEDCRVELKTTGSMEDMRKANSDVQDPMINETLEEAKLDDNVLIAPFDERMAAQVAEKAARKAKRAARKTA